MGVLDVVKKGFVIATKGMGLVLVLFAFNLIGNLASMPFATATPEAAATPQLTTAAMLFSIVFILISIFIQGGTLGVVRDYIKQGRMNLASMAQYGMKYYLRMLLLGVLIVLIIGIIALIAGLIIAATAPLNNPVVTTIAVIIALAIAITVGIFYFIPFTISPYAIVCDEIGAIEAMKKSLQIARKPFIRVFNILLLIVCLVAIALVVGFVVGFLVGLISAALPVEAGRILMMVVTSAINGYLGVVITASFMSYYLVIAGKEAMAGEKVF